jgi:hypothetical protein
VAQKVEILANFFECGPKTNLATPDLENHKKMDIFKVSNSKAPKGNSKVSKKKTLKIKNQYNRNYGLSTDKDSEGIQRNLNTLCLLSEYKIL